jgi:hypothetical protein
MAGVTLPRRFLWVGYQGLPRFSPREQGLGAQRDHDTVQAPHPGDERVGSALERVALPRGAAHPLPKSVNVQRSVCPHQPALVPELAIEFDVLRFEPPLIQQLDHLLYQAEALRIIGF